MSEQELQNELRLEREKTRSIQEIAQAIGSTLDLNELLHLIVAKITELMRAERTTLYVMDEGGEELWTKVLQADELREIRLQLGQGIAGWVAKTGEPVNIADAYEDERFSSATDSKSGYRTRSILCTPMKDNLGRIIGVLQVLNKREGIFTDEDQVLLEAMASQAGIAIENSKLYLSVVRKNQELLETQQTLQRRMGERELLLDVEREINAAGSVDELLELVLHSAAALIGAEAASILIQEEHSDRMLFRGVMGERSHVVRKLSVKLGEGIAGWVAERGVPALVDDPAADERHNTNLAERVGFHPRNLICVPLVGGTFRGAIELLNKIEKDRFDEGDLKLLTLIAGRVSQAIRLARIKDKRLQESRLAAVGQMVSGVLHDLRTPMTIISGYAQLMAQSDDEKTRDEFAARILRQFSVLSSMTREVLAFAQGKSRVLLRKVFMHKFLEEITEALQHEFAGKKIELVVDGRYRGAAQFDETKLRRLFHNIGRNAAQAMKDGGTFTVTVDRVADDLELTFTDTGQGIPQELEGRLFEVFASAGKPEGTGLGLAIVKKIVDEHGGTIDYESTPGAGTTFTVKIPIVAGQKKEGAPEGQANAA
jgi:signal transduction histidine kinase